MPRTVDRIVEFHRSEAEYWRETTERCAAAASLIEEQLSVLHNPGVPPEPPVGTRFDDTNGQAPGMKPGELIWDLRNDGWRCCRLDCPNCPSMWSDVYKYALPQSVSRVIPGSDVTLGES